MEDKFSPAFWRSLKSESIVTLTDEQAIHDSMEAGDGVAGIDYVVGQTLHVREMNDLAEWLLLDLQGNDQDLVLMVKIVDREMAVRIYYEPAEFEPADRAQLLNREEYWLFQGPDEPDDSAPSDLAFTFDIIHSVEIGGEDRELTFRQKAQGEMHGECTPKPPMSGVDTMFATIVEYSTTDDVENPEMLIFEVGDPDNKDGGIVRLMLGADVNLSEVDVLPAK